MATRNQPEAPPSATGGLRAYPRQTEPGSYGARTYGPNGYAFIAFVLGLCGISVISIILACVAFGKIEETDRWGRKLAVAALVLSALWLPFNIYILTH